MAGKWEVKLVQRYEREKEGGRVRWLVRERERREGEVVSEREREKRGCGG